MLCCSCFSSLLFQYESALLNVNVISDFLYSSVIGILLHIRLKHLNPVASYCNQCYFRKPILKALLEKLRNILKWFLPLLFIAYLGGITLFTHSHVVNGVIIVHSHPFKGEHSHTEAQVETIFFLSSFVASSLPTILFVASAFLILLRVLSLSLIHIQMCIRDRCTGAVLLTVGILQAGRRRLLTVPCTHTKIHQRC